MEKRGQKDCKSQETPGATQNGNSTNKQDELGQIDEVIGHFGRYQLLIFFFKILIGAVSAFNNLGVTFFAPYDFVGYWCAENATSHTNLATYNATIAGPPLSLLTGASDLHQHSAAGTGSSPMRLNLQNTRTLDENLLGGFIFGNERRYRHSVRSGSNTPNNLRRECGYTSQLDNKHHKCSSYQYDTGMWISTIIDEWDLVCDRSWMVSMTQSVYMTGFIVSYLVFGYISDRFGRWCSLLIGAIIEVVSGLGCALSGSITQFMIFRFLLGLGNAGRTTSSYLVMIEWCGPKWRMHISTLGSLGWCAGYCLMPWFTLYYIHFRHMQLFVCFYEMIFIIWLMWIPESPRWLLTHKRFDEAYKVLLMAAKFNGLIKDPHTKASYQDLRQLDSPVTLASHGFKQLFTHSLGVKNNKDIQLNLTNFDCIEMANATENQKQSPSATSPISHTGTQFAPSTVNNKTQLRPYSIQEFDAKFQRLVSNIEGKEFTVNEHRLSIVDLFRWKNLRKYALILFFVWAANSFIYYGIVLRIGDFGGKNLFVSFTIAGITELPSIAFTILCMKCLPRKTTNLFIFTSTGLICALQIPLKYYDFAGMQQSTMMLAKLFNTCAFTCVLYQTMELFPTSIRQTAYSSCSLAGRIGSILAPFVKELSQHTNELVPHIMYSTLSIMVAFFIRHIPETKGSDLPDTLLEAEKFNPDEETSKEKEKRKASP